MPSFFQRKKGGQEVFFKKIKGGEEFFDIPKEGGQYFSQGKIGKANTFSRSEKGFWTFLLLMISASGSISAMVMLMVSNI